MSDDDAGLAGLADDLRALGRTVDAAPRPDLADRVLAALDAPERPARVNGARRPLPYRLRRAAGPASSRPTGGDADRTRPTGGDADRTRPARTVGRPRGRRIAALVAMLLIVAAAGVAVASPPVRAAIRHLFAGVEIRPGPAPTPAVSPALPGEHPTDLPGASRAVGFTVLVPTALGPPDAVTVADGRVASLIWHRPGGDVRLDEFAGDLGVMFDKYAASIAAPTAVQGAPALWFASETTIEYVGADGQRYPESTRPTGRTLIWTAGRITLRLDGIPTEADAVAVAATVPG